jgi:hypothetical protein
MWPLSSLDIVEMWEVGRSQHPIDRVLTLLVGASLGVEWENLAALTIGRRDTLLFSLREELYGARIDAYTECPSCGERLEISFSAEEVRALPLPEEPNPDGLFCYQEGETQVTFRLPDSRDLAAVAGNRSLQAARTALLQRCIKETRVAGNVVPWRELREELITGLVDRMSECEPAAEVLFNMSCPSCDKSWQEPFDVASFLWSEVAAHARRLLREVHILARAYGWEEREILSMSDARRECYLEMVGE